MVFVSCSSHYSSDADEDDGETGEIGPEGGDVGLDVVEATPDRDEGTQDYSAEDLAPDSADADEDVEADPTDDVRHCTTPGDCNDDNSCTFDLCASDGTCAYAWQDDGTACSDETFCNGDDTCLLGRCVHAGNPCTPTDNCDEDNDWCRCDDGNRCTGSDHITDSGCVGTNTDDVFCPACDDGGCNICCAGSCVNATQHSLCGVCGYGCSSGESCVYSPGAACGHPWCCGT